MEILNHGNVAIYKDEGFYLVTRWEGSLETPVDKDTFTCFPDALRQAAEWYDGP